MKMQVLTVQQQPQYGVFGSNKLKDWASTLISPVQASQSNGIGGGGIGNNSHNNNNNNNNNKKLTSSNNLKNKSNIEKTNNSYHRQEFVVDDNNDHDDDDEQPIADEEYQPTTFASSPTPTHLPQRSSNLLSNNLFYYCDDNNSYCNDIDEIACEELSLRLLAELRAAKSQHLTCTEVSLPCDLTPRIATEIIRISEKEPCGIRGCTIYIDFADDDETSSSSIGGNGRRIATIKLDPETVSTFEVYLQLKQEHRGWTSLLPQFMKSLARTITISPDFTITKRKLYSPSHHSSYSYSITPNGGEEEYSSNEYCCSPAMAISS